MALPSERESCRRCGGQMEEGVVVAGGGLGGTAKTILWYPAKPGVLPVSTDGSVPLSPLSARDLLVGRSPGFRALLCPSCRIVEFQFG